LEDLGNGAFGWVQPDGVWDYMLGLELDNVVPGHGPITDKRGVRAHSGGAMNGLLVMVVDSALPKLNVSPVLQRLTACRIIGFLPGLPSVIIVVILLAVAASSVLSKRQSK
jgi:hypothetical protein